MEVSLESFPKSILEMMLDICWGQWSALGIYSSVTPETERAIDLEALICATMFFGRYDPRLFDETLDWIAANAKIISLDRLKRIADIFSPKCRACLGASIDYLMKEARGVRFASSVERWKKFKLDEKENLFRRWGTGKELRVKEADASFLEWGFLRNKPKLRGLSGKPDLDNDANVFLRLRKLFGVTSRASVTGYLLLKGEGNSTKISREVYANQRNVYGILMEMADGRFLKQSSGVRESVFSIDRAAWLDFLGVVKDLVYVGWADVFSAFQYLLDDWAADKQAYSTEYLASSRLRENAQHIIQKLAAAGVDYRIPDLDRRHGEAYFSEFVKHVQEYLGHL